MATAPLKVNPDADALASNCAHFLGITKNQFASDAIRAYARIKRAQGVPAAMDRLDGTSDTKVAVLSGLSDDELEALGGLS